MARLPRIIVKDATLHIAQRGVDRCPTFLAADDYAFFLWALREAAVHAQCAVHAYVLMTNHIHLLVTAGEVDGPARMMRSLGRRYVRYFNDRYRRTGTLWEGRYRSALVGSVPYLFACSRYIELNPVRAHLVTDPDDYEWSSFGRNARGEADELLTEHPHYTSLGSTRKSRCEAYLAMFATELTAGTTALVRAAQRGRPALHPSSYREAIDAVFGREGSEKRTGDARVERSLPTPSAVRPRDGSRKLVTEGVSAM